VLPVHGEHELAPVISQIAKSGDIVVCLGAGTITDWAHALPEWLGGPQAHAVAAVRGRES
jgi:UDP-N-acetylmuramate--alanine ligase